MANQILFANNAVGVLSVACIAAATTLQLSATQAALFPVPAANQAFYIQVQNGAAIERMLVTNNTGGVFTVLRGQEGTIAQPFAAGSVVSMCLTAAVLQSFIQATSTAFAALAGNTKQTFDVASAVTPTNAVPLAQAQLLFANAALLPSAAQIAQPGDIKYSAVSTVPAGWLAANGALVSRTTYAALFTAIGTTFGVGDGATTFALPDLRGVFVRGLDSGRGYDPGRVFGSYQADNYASHSHANTLTDPTHAHGTTDPQHHHGLGETGLAALGGGNYVGSLTAGSNGVTAAASTGITINAASTGITINNVASGGTETTPKNVALLALIKT